MSDGDFWCPLLYRELDGDRFGEPLRRPTGGPTIGILGSLRGTRSIRLLNLIRQHATQPPLNIIFFPSDDFGSSYDDKIKFLRHCDAIWNVYCAPYNQSGVTGDCIMANVPVFVSKYEPNQSLLSKLNLGCVIDISASIDDMVYAIYDFIDFQRKEFAAKACSNSQIASSFGGRQAFRRQWLPFIRTILVSAEAA